MQGNIFSRGEFISKIGVSSTVFEQWEQTRLVKPAGFTEDHIPYYSEAMIERALQLKRLLEVGYGVEEVKEIVQKVGLPKNSTAKGETTKPNQYLTVGSLAEAVGVSARTVKHWEEVGIIEPDMRSDGGFRLYSRTYIYLCKLVRDLQLFGYTLEEIKVISDHFRDFLVINRNLSAYSKTETARKLEEMLEAIKQLFEKMNLLREGIERWEGLLKKKRKEVVNLKNQNAKRTRVVQGEANG